MDWSPFLFAAAAAAAAAVARLCSFVSIVFFCRPTGAALIVGATHKESKESLVALRRPTAATYIK